MATDENDRRLAAPGEMELVRDFVNTRDLKHETDRIDEPRRLASWITEQGLAPAGLSLTDEDVDRTRKLREALRAMLLANAAFPLAQEASEAFNDAARSARLEIRAEDDGRVALVPAGEGLERAIGRLLAIVVAAQENGTWHRLKACAECRWALYDRTENRSAAWCDPAKCGARGAPAVIAGAGARRTRRPMRPGGPPPVVRGPDIGRRLSRRSILLLRHRSTALYECTGFGRLPSWRWRRSS